MDILILPAIIAFSLSILVGVAEEYEPYPYGGGQWIIILGIPALILWALW